MSQTIELPDPLFAEISGYASRMAESPVVVLGQAWEEFRQRHPAQAANTLRRDAASTLRNPPPPLTLGAIRPAWTSRADLLDELYERGAG